MSSIGQIQSEYYFKKGNRQVYLDKYYKNNKNIVPIYGRASASPLKDKTHTNTHTNFFKDIVARKVGYMGQLIEFTTKDEAAAEKLKLMERVTKQKTMNSDSVKRSSIQGISHRLVYTEDGIFKIKNLDADQVVYEYDNDIYDPERAYYFYRLTDLDGEYEDRCNVYDRTTVTYYRKTKDDKRGTSGSQGENVGGSYSIVGETQEHNFNQVPVIPFLNNGEWNSDCEDTVELMDAYDEINSDEIGELKAARLAYLKLWGDLYTGEDRDGNPIPLPDYLTQFGTMLFPTDPTTGKPEGDASFLEKSIDDTAIENTLKRLRTNIYELSGSIDLKELTDSSSARVFTVRASLLRLESNAKTTENYLIMALNKQFDLWTYWISQLEGTQINPIDIKIKIGRNFITDEAERAQTLSILLTSMDPVDAFKTLDYQDPQGLAERYEKNQVLAIPTIDTEEE